MAETAASTGPNEGSGGHLQEFERDRLFADAVDVAYQVEQVVVVDLLFPVGQREELVVGGVQFFRREVVA